MKYLVLQQLLFALLTRAFIPKDIRIIIDDPPV